MVLARILTDGFLDHSLELSCIEAGLELSLNRYTVLSFPENIIHHAGICVDTVVNAHFKSTEHDGDDTRLLLSDSPIQNRDV